MYGLGAKKKGNHRLKVVCGPVWVMFPEISVLLFQEVPWRFLFHRYWLPFFTLLFNFRIFNYPKIMFFIPFFLYVSFLILLHDATLSRAENFCSISIPTH
jgi:hypothetical protein